MVRGDRGRMRASHADREQVIEVLKDAFAHARLTRDELDARAGQALTEGWLRPRRAAARLTLRSASRASRDTSRFRSRLASLLSCSDRGIGSVYIQHRQVGLP